MRESTSLGMSYHAADHAAQGSVTRRGMLGDDMWEEATRSPSSTQIYNSAVGRPTPRSIVRVTMHEGPPPIQARASRLRPSATHEPQTNVSPLPRSRQQTHSRFVRWLTGRSLLFYLSVGMLLLFGGGILVTMLVHWGQVTLDDWHYGRPRTFQTDADVGHGGVSHFTVVNLHGHTIVTEFPNNDPTKTKIYTGPTLVGNNTELAPVTLSFEEINGDGLLDKQYTRKHHVLCRNSLFLWH